MTDEARPLFGQYVPIWAVSALSAIDTEAVACMDAMQLQCAYCAQCISGRNS